jgi:type IV pilus assembly protein PilZ
MVQGSNVRARPPIELKVEYRKLNSFFADYTKNISKGGTFIRTEKPLKTGTEFVFRLSIPQRAEPFILHGRVTWAHGVDPAVPVSPGERGMGISFVFRNEEDRRAFADEVEERMRASLGDLIVERLLDVQ